MALVALAQLAAWLPALLFGHDHSAPVHVAHEMGSLDIALAAGFLVAAWRPPRALGMLTLVAVAAGLLVLTAAIDLATGYTGPADEAPHLLVVVGWLLLRRVASLAPLSTDRPRAASALVRQLLAVVPSRAKASVPGPGAGYGVPASGLPGTLPAGQARASAAREALG